MPWLVKCLGLGGDCKRLIEFAFHFIEYEYDFGAAMEAISEKCQKTFVFSVLISMEQGSLS